MIFTVSSVSLCRSVHASVPESFRASVVRSARRSSGFFFLVKAALAAGKNRKVLLLMMRAFAPSATTASDPTTSSGFGSGLSSGSQSKNSHSYLKLILCRFLPNSCPHTKFHPSRTKNIKVKNICYWLALVSWSGQSKNSCIDFKLILFEF